MKPRNPRSDSAAAAIQAAQNAADGPHDPPAHTPLPDGARPFWDAIMRNRARHRWDTADLGLAAVLARGQFDVHRLLAEIEREGDMVDDKPNPKHVIVDRLVKRVTSLSASLHVNAEATQGRVQDQGNTLRLDREAEGNVHPLIQRRA